MKARKNPTLEQIARRLRRSPLSHDDPRTEKDGYYALKIQGYSHGYAIRAFRDQPPTIRQCADWDVDDEYIRDMDECFFPAGSNHTRIEIEVRPELSEAAILTLKPRESEYTVWDHVVPRFGVRVRASGHMSYVVNYHVRYQKNLHKFTIGRCAEFSLEQARNVAREIRREARMGNDPVKCFGGIARKL